MKRIMFSLFTLMLTGFFAEAYAQSSGLPVFSANGFVCGKEGMTVTCKGPVPGGTDTVTGTGHNLIYLTINTKDKSTGQPLRYTYFSDTGCLLGYSFNAAGNPVSVVAVHRNGNKKTFEFNEQGYEKIIDYCIQDSPVGGSKMVNSPAAAAGGTSGNKPTVTAKPSPH